MCVSVSVVHDVCGLGEWREGGGTEGGRERGGQVCGLGVCGSRCVVQEVERVGRGGRRVQEVCGLGGVRFARWEVDRGREVGEGGGRGGYHHNKNDDEM